MKNIVKIILSLSLVITTASALKKDEIQAQMTKKIDEVLNIIKTHKGSNQEKGEKIIKIVDEIFDYKTMAMLSLGKNTWRSISNDEKKEFIKLFSNKLKNSYIEKLKLYTGQEVKVKNLEESKKRKVKLNTEIIGQNETYKVAYNFYNKKGDWLIYDVDLLGVSLIKTYYNNYSEFLREKSFAQLLETLKK